MLCQLCPFMEPYFKAKPLSNWAGKSALRPTCWGKVNPSLNFLWPIPQIWTNLGTHISLSPFFWGGGKNTGVGCQSLLQETFLTQGFNPGLPHCILSPAYLTYMQIASGETLGWKKHKLESRLLGEISITSDMQMTPPVWQKVKRN